MPKFTTSTERHPLSFMSDICLIISEYAESNGISVLPVATAIYHNVRGNDSFVAEDKGHTSISSEDSVVSFVHSIVEAIAVFAYAHDLDIEDMASAIWYASTKVYMEDTYGTEYYEAVTNNYEDE